MRQQQTRIRPKVRGRLVSRGRFPDRDAFVFHPGDADGALAALGKATRVRLRSDGAGLDSGEIDIKLPTEALNWLKQ